MIRSTVLLLLLFTGIQLYAQDPFTPVGTSDVKNDSLITESKDTVLLKSYATRYNPRKALLYAAVLPGLGQIYNKKYWKLPLVYGGMVWIGHFIGVYQKGYTETKLRLFKVIDGYRDPDGFTIEQLRPAVNRYRRERDFMIILMGGVYLLQIIDAHVDAHLKEFDLNPNLQVKFEPMIENDQVLGRQAGFSIFLKF